MTYNPSLIKPQTNGQARRDLESLHPKVEKIAVQFLKEANERINPLGFTVKIISTLRTWPEQQSLYEQGRTNPGKIVTNAKPGKSNHNWGVAFDIGIFEKGEYDTKNSQAQYKVLGPIGEKHGLDWGGRWKSPADLPHFQHTGKYSNTDFLNKVNVNNIDELLDYKEFSSIEAFLKSIGEI